MTSRTAQRRKTEKAKSQADDPLERALRDRPRCQCKHGTQRCTRTASHRVSSICKEPGCRSAVHVQLLCATCKEQWVSHSRRCSSCPELRVAPL